jgi:hypothetical protein
LILSRQLAQGLELSAPLRKLRRGGEQFRTRERGGLLGSFAQRHGLELVGFERGVLLDKRLLAPFKDGVAMRAKFLPQPLFLVAPRGP